MWNVAEGKTVRILVGHCGTVLSVAFSPCGTLLASAGNYNYIDIS
jgi:WD40 repeat protein